MQPLCDSTKRLFFIPPLEAGVSDPVQLLKTASVLKGVSSGNLYRKAGNGLLTASPVLNFTTV